MKDNFSIHLGIVFMIENSPYLLKDGFPMWYQESEGLLLCKDSDVSHWTGDAGEQEDAW